MPTLETVSGRVVDPEHIDPDSIDIHDIAWSLSRISRFSGHTTTETAYNVAQHSVFVAKLMIDDGLSGNVVLYGLLHDGAEAYIGDIPSPVKKIPALKAVIDPIEDSLLTAIYTKYVGGDIISSTDHKLVKFYDKKAQFIEAHAFMSSRGLSWPGRDEYNITLMDIQKFPQPVSSIDAYKSFIDMFEYLKG
jgi:5'-deoxynucleotidase YfbR-like HD superfamily hydrolase